MKYRGFIITSCTDNSILRQDDSGNEQLCNGYYCQVYSADDDMYANQIDDFCLAVGHEIEDMSDSSLNRGIVKQIDGMYESYVDTKVSLNVKRTEELLGRALCWIGEMESGSDLYNTLSEVIGMTDIEMHRLGFCSLSEHFDKNGFAQTIADYFIETGTELTQSGNYHFEFSEINERFGVNLPHDTELLGKLTEQLTSGENSLVVSDLNMDTDIDINFYTLYCPNVIEEDCSEGFIQSM
ncbi:MAG: hypothetical protein IKT38_03630 [Clostridia bacterium]|nr:hypothetical protein [Clostridia bacterium]